MPDRLADVVHGRYSNVPNKKCNCDECKRAWNERARLVRGTDPDDGLPRWFDKWADSAGSL